MQIHSFYFVVVILARSRGASAYGTSSGLPVAHAPAYGPAVVKSELIKPPAARVQASSEIKDSKQTLPASSDDKNKGKSIEPAPEKVSPPEVPTKKDPENNNKKDDKEKEESKDEEKSKDKPHEKEEAKPEEESKHKPHEKPEPSYARENSKTTEKSASIPTRPPRNPQPTDTIDSTDAKTLTSTYEFTTDGKTSTATKVVTTKVSKSSSDSYKPISTENYLENSASPNQTSLFSSILFLIALCHI